MGQAKGHCYIDQALEVFGADRRSAVSAHHLVFPRNHADYPRVGRFLAWMRTQLGSDFAY